MFKYIKVLYIKLWTSPMIQQLILILSHTTPMDHYLNKHECILPENAYTQDATFLSYWFFEENIIKQINFIFILMKNIPSLWTQPYPLESLFGQTRPYTNWGCCHTCYNFSRIFSLYIPIKVVWVWDQSNGNQMILVSVDTHMYKQCLGKK